MQFIAGQHEANGGSGDLQGRGLGFFLTRVVRSPRFDMGPGLRLNYSAAAAVLATHILNEIRSPCWKLSGPPAAGCYCLKRSAFER